MDIGTMSKAEVSYRLALHPSGWAVRPEGIVEVQVIAESSLSAVADWIVTSVGIGDRVTVALPPVFVGGVEYFWFRIVGIRGESSGFWVLEYSADGSRWDRCWAFSDIRQLLRRVGARWCELERAALGPEPVDRGRICLALGWGDL